MAVLASTLYDPATVVTKSLTASTAMAAFDTTNLRLTFTVPSTGRVLVRIACSTDAGSNTSVYLVLFGVLNGATVVARMPAAFYRHGNMMEAVFVVPGLTPGASLTWDAAYGVETTAASGSLKYGGPNNTTASDAGGAFAYEIWSA